jgi:ribosome maturation factor RimP
VDGEWRLQDDDNARDTAAGSAAPDAAAGGAAEARLITETGLDARVARIVEPAIAAGGYRLVRVRVSGQNGCTCQIMAERADGTLTIDDCERISRAVSPLLDVDDPIGREYHLEVSSPGIDRPLVRRADFARWTGHEAKLEAGVPVNGRRRWRGQIVGLEGDSVGVRLAELGQDTQWVPLGELTDARLVLTDALIAESLRASKRAGTAPADADFDDDGDDDAPPDGDDRTGTLN